MCNHVNYKEVATDNYISCECSDCGEIITLYDLNIISRKDALEIALSMMSPTEPEEREE